MADQRAKRAAQSNDLIDYILRYLRVPLPETPFIYQEWKTSRLTVRALNKIIWVFPKEGQFSLPRYLQWKLANSLHATTHLRDKALQRLLKDLSGE